MIWNKWINAYNAGTNWCMWCKNKMMHVMQEWFFFFFFVHGWSLQSSSLIKSWVQNQVSTCAIVHQTQNSAGFLPWKWGTSIAIFSQQNLGENSVLCAMTHLRQNAVGFSSGNLATILKRTSKALIKTTPLPKIKPQSSILLKPQKLMPITCF